MKRLANLLAMLFLLVISSCTEPEPVVREDGATSPHVLFRSQLVVNSSVGKLNSPHASMESAWTGRTGNSNEYFASVFVAAIRIDDALLSAAARMQMHNLAIGIERQGEWLPRVVQELRAKFTRIGGISYLIIIDRPPAKYAAEWRLKIDDIDSAIFLAPYNRSEILQSEMDSCYHGEPISLYSNVVSCFVVFKNVIKDTDPVSRIAVKGLRFEIRQDFSDSKEWILASDSSSVYLRFDNSEVPLVSMIERNIPWNVIDSTYIAPSIGAMRAGSGDDAIQFLLGLAQNIIAGAILKSIRL